MKVRKERDLIVTLRIRTNQLQRTVTQYTKLFFEECAGTVVDIECKPALPLPKVKAIRRSGDEVRTWLVVVLLLLCAAPAFAMQQTVRDDAGRIVGYLDAQSDRTVVRDCNSIRLGYATKTGTYDDGGRKLYDTFVPAVLLRNGCHADKARR